MSKQFALTAITKATAELAKQQKASDTAALALTGLLEQVPAVQQEIQELSLKKDELASDLDLAVRQYTIDLDMRKQEAGEEVLTQLLEARGLIRTTQENIDTLVNRAQTAEANLNQAVNEAVAKTMRKVKQEHELKAAQESAATQVTNAQNQAKIESLETQLDSAKQQIEMLKEQLSDERKAGVQRAEAAGSMTINTGGK